MKRLHWEPRRAIYNLVGYDYQSPTQLKAHQSRAQTIIVCGGERAGKSVWLARELLPHLLIPVERPEERSFMLIGPSYHEPRVEFQYLVDDLNRLKALKEKPGFPNEGRCSLTTVTGNRLITWSAEDPTSIRGVSPSGIAVCEIGKVPHDAWGRIVSRVSTTGGFIIASGTFETATSWLVDLFRTGLDYGKDENATQRDLQAFAMPTWENTIRFPGGYGDPALTKVRLELGEELFALRCGAEPRPPMDRVLPLTWEHVSDVVFDPSHPAYVWIDPGWYPSVYAILAVQFIENKIRVIDELYYQKVTTEEIAQEAEKRPWWPNVPKGRGRPSGAIDVESPEAAAVWANHGLSLGRRKVKPEVGAARARSFLSPPRIVINRRCRGLLSECGLAEFAYPGMEVWKYGKDGKPSNRYNHSSSALVYGIVDFFGYGGMSKPLSQRKVGLVAA